MNHLTNDDRSAIYHFRKIGKSFGFIGRHLGRPTSTISREFKRNKRPVHGYDAVDAQLKAEARKEGKREAYKFKDKNLKSFVVNLLEQKISPEQISGRAKKHGFKISHEAIYQFVYRDKIEGGNLWKNLRHKRRRRKPRFKAVRKPRIKNRRGIETRPKIVELKKRFGDLEIDTIIGRHHNGAILTVVDRASKYLWAKFIGRKTAENVNLALLELLKGINVKSITADNGPEFTYHEAVAKLLNADFFFADPYSSWQRGLNEHTNGLLRQYFPKKTYFNSKTLQNLDQVVKEINNRPRKVLNFNTPQEVISSLKFVDNSVKNST